MVARADVVAQARSYLGVRWRHQGRTAAGLDCVGLVVRVCQDLGLSDYDSTAYGRDPDARKFLSHFVAGGAVRIDPKLAADGDLIAFHQSGFPCHAGIRATLRGGPSVIHAHMNRRQVCEEMLAPEAPLVAVYRLPGVED